MASFASAGSSAPSGAVYPRTKLVVRLKAGLRAYVGPPTEPAREEDVLLGVELGADAEYVTAYASPAGAGAGAAPVVPAEAPCFSPNGQFGAVLLPSGSTVITAASTGAAVIELPTDSTTMNMDFSPKGTFLVTWARLIAGKPAAEGGSGNISSQLKIWHVASGACVCSFSQKQYRRDLVQWTEDEAVCGRLVSNEVHLLAGLRPEQGIVGKVYHKGVSAFKLCPVSAKPYVCVFSPSAGGRPGQLALYRYHGITATAAAATAAAGEGGPTLAACVTSRGVMSATEADLLWSPTGAAVLAHTQSEVDSSNSSYYGASGLSILSCAGCEGAGAGGASPEKDAAAPLSAAVSQGKDGHIHDVKWSPCGNQFVISAGAMPCVCTLHNQTGEKVYDFGTNHRNTIAWSPHGRFLALAGFGNLVGDIDFYDTQAKKIKKMGSNNAHCSVAHAWSPDSRYFMTATLAPRMNVDNGFKIFR
jgi:translation initiation factor 2A